MKKTLVSIIVPVYNGEEFIDSCMDSLLNQTMKEIEIICINDGSKDSSLKVLNKYLDKIKIITKQNEGVYKARKDGIKASSGQYVCFIDVDDTVSSDYCEKLYKNMVKYKSDIAVCGYERIDIETKKTMSTEMINFGKDYVDINDECGELISINSSLWNKMYRLELLKNKFDLKSIPRISEDLIFLYSLYPNCKRVSFVNESLYSYYVHKNSAMKSFNDNDIASIENGLLELRDYYNAKKKLLSLLDLMVFFNYGFVLACNIDKKFGLVINRTRKFMNLEFPYYKKSKFMKFKRVFKKEKRNSKIYIIYVVYKIRLIKPFVWLYRFITTKLKLSLKW